MWGFAYLGAGEERGDGVPARPRREGVKDGRPALAQRGHQSGTPLRGEAGGLGGHYHAAEKTFRSRLGHDWVTFGSRLGHVIVTFGSRLGHDWVTL
eukprot:1106572-Prorocentrum_minimum.AAC.1